MKDLVKKFSENELIVLHPCTATFATAEACMMALKHRRFIGCEIDAACSDESMVPIVEVFARRFLNEESNIVRSERVKGAAKIYLEAAKAIAANRRVLVWDPPPGRTTTQTFPLQILRFLSNEVKLSTFL